MEQEGTRFYGVSAACASTLCCKCCKPQKNNGAAAGLLGAALSAAARWRETLTGGKKECGGATEDAIRDRQHQATSLANHTKQEEPESSAPARPPGGHPCQRDDSVVLQQQPNVQPEEKSRHTGNSSGQEMTHRKLTHIVSAETA